MKLEIAPEIKADQKLESAIQTNVAQALQRVLGQSAPLVTARFDVARDLKERPVIRVRISDFTSAVEADFAPDELLGGHTLESLERRFDRMWGDLLQKRSEAQVNKVKELAAHLDEE